jgi:acetyl esterase/lipase
MKNTPDSQRCEIVYSTPEGVELKGDLYTPFGQSSFPLLVGVPGGAWRFCSRGSLAEWGEYLAARGVGFFAIDYRVATATREAFPEAVCDVLEAVRCIRACAAQYYIDPDRIGLIGVSAGAHLAALAALSPDHVLFQPEHSTDAGRRVSAHVKAFIGLYGIYDLFKHWQDDLTVNAPPDGNVAKNFLGVEPYENQQIYFDASPIRHIEYSKNKIPALVAWGSEDEFVSPSQSEAFVRALLQARFNVRTHKAMGASHFWFNQSLKETSNDSAIFAPRLLQFLEFAL